MNLKTTLRVNSPWIQNLVIGCVLFCEPGLYAALTGLGAGGGKPSSATVANDTNAILYGLFALSSWFAGAVVNIIKPRWSVFIGSFGYPLYIAGLWYYDRVGNEWFPLWAGAMLGLLCGILFPAATFIQFSYPEEKDKGKYISTQFMMKASGSFVGALIAFGASHDQTKAVGVSTPVYAVFIVIQCAAIVFGVLLLVHPAKVVRNDGRHIAVFKHPDPLTEFKNVGKAFVNKNILILFPAMLVSEMPLAMVSTINSNYFNLRTRSLNNMLFQFIQIIVPFAIMYLLDSTRISSRRRRGIIGTCTMGLVAIGGSIGLYIWINVVGYDSINFTADPPSVDWSSDRYAGIFVIYMLFGACYSGFQVVLEWLLAALTNDPSSLAQFAGMVKGTQSFGMCISFILAGQKVPLVGQLSVQFGLYILGTIGMVYINYFQVKDTNYFMEADVIVPRSVEESAGKEEEAKRTELNDEAIEPKT